MLATTGIWRTSPALTLGMAPVRTETGLSNCAVEAEIKNKKNKNRFIMGFLARWRRGK